MKKILLVLSLGVLLPIAGKCGDNPGKATGALKTPFDSLSGYCTVVTHISRGGIEQLSPVSEKEAKMDAILADAHTKQIALLRMKTAPQDTFPITGRVGY